MDIIRVAIAIPFYRISLTQNERISLSQARKIFSKRDIFLFCPKFLIKKLKYKFKGIHIISFPDRFFKNTDTYSQLLLSSEFYLSFSEYTHILIYQLDAFVFFDQLDIYCRMPYDYIGAPLPRWMGYWNKFGLRVGNGGFSLRNVSACYRMVQKRKEIIAQVEIRKIFDKYEDLYFAYCGKIRKDDFCVAPVFLAKKFSLEHDVGHSFRNLSKHLPMGCHGWNKINYFSWKEIIENMGYETDPTEFLGNTFLYRRNAIKKYLSYRILRDNNKEKLNKFFERCFNKERDFSIWGCGTIGKYCLRLIKQSGRNLLSIYDLHFRGSVANLPVLLPNQERIRKEKAILIVATTQYEEEIVNCLYSWEMKEEDFITYEHLLAMIMKAYIGKG